MFKIIVKRGVLDYQKKNRSSVTQQLLLFVISKKVFVWFRDGKVGHI